MTKKRKARLPAPRPQRKNTDVVISDPVGEFHGATEKLANDRLTFDGYKLRWQGESSDEFNAFSGQADTSARESKKDYGPTPQGLFAVDPKNIEEFEPSDDWGENRVRVEPYRATVARMTDCFEAIRTDMFIHGGRLKGTSGCIEINNDDEEKRFFSKLKKYGRKIELEVKFVGEMERRLEETRCPY